MAHSPLFPRMAVERPGFFIHMVLLLHLIAPILPCPEMVRHTVTLGHAGKQHLDTPYPVTEL